MPVRNYIKRKCNYLTNRYGKNAAEYFLNFPKCEKCGEERLACLAVHHKHGKKVDEFQTLCFNCHMVVHAKKSGNLTFKDVQQKEDHKKKLKNLRNKQIVDLALLGKTTREIGKAVGVSNAWVSIVCKKSGIVKIPRQNKFIPK